MKLPTNSELDRLKIDPQYSFLYSSAIPAGAETVDPTSRVLFREDTKTVDESVVLSGGDDTEDNTTLEYRGGAIVKCLDEMKKLTEACQKRYPFLFFTPHRKLLPIDRCDLELMDRMKSRNDITLEIVQTICQRKRGLFHLLIFSSLANKVT